MRDAAYEALSKSTRARLHEGFAGWLEQRGRDLVEHDEILGYHLEQAARYTQELGAPDPVLAERAAEHLAAAGRRAGGRLDLRAARRLFERALVLTRPLRLDMRLELYLAQMYLFHEPLVGAAIAEAAGVRAREAGDEAGEAVAGVVSASSRRHYGEIGVEELEARA